MAAKFKNVLHRPLPVDIGKQSFVVMPNRVFEVTRPKHRTIQKLLKEKKIVRV